MELTTIPISQIKRAAYNPRVDLVPGMPEYEALQRSVHEFGLVEPLVWNKRTGNLVGGHQRLTVLAANGATEVEVSVVDLDDENEKALNVALNKVRGDWDRVKLGELLNDIQAAGGDITITGMTDDELQGLLTIPGAGDLADLSGYELNDTEELSFVVHLGEAERFVAVLSQLAQEAPPGHVAPMGWALEQALASYERGRMN